MPFTLRGRPTRAPSVAGAQVPDLGLGKRPRVEGRLIEFLDERVDRHQGTGRALPTERDGVRLSIRIREAVELIYGERPGVDVCTVEVEASVDAVRSSTNATWCQVPSFTVPPGNTAALVSLWSRYSANSSPLGSTRSSIWARFVWADGQTPLHSECAMIV